MENQSNSNKSSNGNEALLGKQEQNNTEDKSLRKQATGLEYHNYVPKHSNHGRSNTRTFGSDHEPGTMR